MDSINTTTGSMITIREQVIEQLNAELVGTDINNLNLKLENIYKRLNDERNDIEKSVSRIF